MLVAIGVLVVLAAVIGGYLMEHGNLAVLVQPAELVIIGGASVGTLLIANPLSTVIQVVKAVLGSFRGGHFSKDLYLETLKMLNGLFRTARREGMAKLEADVDEPEKSQLFIKYPKFFENKHALDFVCDTLRVALTGDAGDFELDQMMELDIEVLRREAGEPVHALTSVADALPGLGIVAAVLGVVITMGSIGGPPEEVGHKVAAALVGTFLGILLCYGFVGPLAANVTKRNEAESQYLQVLRMGLIAFIKGCAPAIAIEFARRSIPAHVRPSFSEMERACKEGAAAA